LKATYNTSAKARDPTIRESRMLTETDAARLPNEWLGVQTLPNLRPSVEG
jgi:hypothetical protein